jgi:hypothetical protein
MYVYSPYIVDEEHVIVCGTRKYTSGFANIPVLRDM